MQRLKKALHLKLADRKLIQGAIVTNFKENVAAIIINTAAFIMIAVLVNFLADFLVYNTAILTNLKEAGVIAINASGWALLLFFKNIFVIPFTIIFETFFFLWLINKLILKIPALKIS